MLRVVSTAAVAITLAVVLAVAFWGQGQFGARADEPDAQTKQADAVAKSKEGEPVADEARLRVMTFNIRYDNAGDGENRWRNRRDAVAAVIAENKVDVVGLQEALERQIDDLAQRLPDYAWYGVGRDDGKTRGEFAPIFYRKDRFEVIDKGVFWLSETPETPGSKSWDAAITRLVTWIEFRDKTADCTFFAFNTHFDHIGTEARLRSAALIRERIPRIAGEKPTVLTGDLNCVATSAPYRTLTEKGDADVDRPPALLDTRKVSLTDPRGPDSTWNGFTEIESGRIIDYVFVSAGWRVASHATIDERVEGRFVSDHLPVLAEITLVQ